MKIKKEEKQMQNSFIGIDVSKLTLDVCIINHEGFQEHQQFEKIFLLLQ